MGLTPAASPSRRFGELLRRKGIYSSQFSTWRAQREQEGLAELAGLSGKRPGPKPTKDAKDCENEKRDRRMAQLEKELRISRR